LVTLVTDITHLFPFPPLRYKAIDARAGKVRSAATKLSALRTRMAKQKQEKDQDFQQREKLVLIWN